MAATAENKNTDTTSKALDFVSSTTDATAGALTVTAAMILGGLMLRDPAGGARTDTLSTAALLATAIPGVRVGTAIRLIYRNTGGETITVISGVGGTDSGTMTIATLNTKEFNIVFTAIGASPTYTCYSLGTKVH